MLKFKTYLFILLSIFALYGCVSLNLPKTKSVAILIKSPMIKISDVGFIHFYHNHLNLQIYNSGKDILNLNVKNLICINNACSNKLDFNQKFFLNEYYSDFLEDLLRMKPIYNGLNLILTKCGFEQIISKNFVQYTVCNNKMSFIDNKNGIKITMRELD